MLCLRPLFALALLPAVAIAEDSRPHVLFIAIDDLNSWGALGGHPQIETPHLDRLADRGTLFTNAHCAAPACNPSRAAVMTGMHPATSGIYLNGQDWRENQLVQRSSTLPQHFRDHGYKVLGGGKLYHASSLNEKAFTGYLDPEPWHDYFPSKQRQMPPEIVPDPFPSNGTTQFYKGFFDWAPLAIEDEEMADSQVVEWARAQLLQSHDQPLFLAVGIYRPHIPWYVPQAYFDAFPLEGIQLPEAPGDDLDDIPEAGRSLARRDWHQWVLDQDQWKKAVQGYLASIRYTDTLVGRLLDALDEGPLADDTIVVLWSDHGYHLGHKEHWEKFALWEQTTRVPLIIAAPGHAREQECAQPTSLLDLFPTLADLCGLPELPQFDGQSLTPQLRDPEPESDRTIVTTQGYQNHAVRSQHWRYIRYDDGSEELYDHRRDPQEFTNLAKDPAFADVLSRHAARLPSVNARYDPQPATGSKRFKPIHEVDQQLNQSGKAP